MKWLLSLAMVAVLFGCGSAGNTIDELAPVVDEAVVEEVEPKVVTASDIEPLLTNLLPEDRDWKYGLDDELAFFQYEGFYLDLMDTVKYDHLEKFQEEWLALTNQMVRLQQRHEETLRDEGWEGGFMIMVVDDYDEPMFAVGDGGVWKDMVYDTNGTGERTGL